MKLRKSIGIALAAVIAAFSLIALAGCSQEPSAEEIEAVILESVTSELESMKNLDSDLVAAVESEEGLNAMEAYGVDGMRFMTAFLDGFDYEIGEITVGDGRADLTVTLTCKSAAEYASNLESGLLEYLEGYDTSTMTEEELNVLIGDASISVMEAIVPSKTDPIPITYIPNADGLWEMTEESNQSLQNAMFAL